MNGIDSIGRGRNILLELVSSLYLLISSL
jgi:hypothetical protein